MYPNSAKPPVRIRSIIWYTSQETKLHFGLYTPHTIEAAKWTAHVIEKKTENTENTEVNMLKCTLGLISFSTVPHLTLMQYLITISSLAYL